MSLPDASFPPSAQALAFDVRNLDGLRRQVREQPPANSGQQKEVARQFEALFLQMMIKRMREATPRDGLFESDQTRMAQAMADEQLALQLATPGMGLARAILQQIQALQGPGREEAGAGWPQAGRQPPEIGNSRLPGLRSRLGQDLQDGPAVTPAVSALLDLLASGGQAQKAIAAREGAPAHVIAFVEKMGPAARRAEAQSGIPARLILGQAALESGWGRREIRHPDGSPSYNVFGIKATPGWRGKAVDVVTTEYVDGRPQKMVQAFRAYGSYAEAFADYARLVGESPRYQRVGQARDEIEAARRIQEAGYATDPRYADKLIGIMDQFGPRV
ncbi:flagellar assembly peptidoglycan hydrolase FlgJ [Orrella sp. JC864]|uniref:flagellar assembly peptidoglycan hydrolase FlgJ n=1 Tax=Orrella sp. JC864 TaxID=3120298 RepID=UPI0012BBCE33